MLPWHVTPPARSRTLIIVRITSAVASATTPSTTTSSSSVNARPFCVPCDIWLTSSEQLIKHVILAVAAIVARPLADAGEDRRHARRRRREDLPEAAREDVEVLERHHAVVVEVA